MWGGMKENRGTDTSTWEDFFAEGNEGLWGMLYLVINTRRGVRGGGGAGGQGGGHSSNGSETGRLGIREKKRADSGAQQTPKTDGMGKQEGSEKWCKQDIRERSVIEEEGWTQLLPALKVQKMRVVKREEKITKNRH